VTDATLAAVAAYRLPSRTSFPQQPLTDAEFEQLVESAVSHRLLGLLGEAVGAEALPATDAQWEVLEAELRVWAAHIVRVERLAVRVLEAFTASGVRARVLKGVGLAHTVYEPADLRVFGDVDLLIAGDDLARAQRVLEQQFDGERVQPELRPGFDRRFGREVLVRCDGIEVDLHRVFVDGAFGLTIRVDDLFAPPYRFPLAGYELTALPMPQRLLHAAYAAAIGDWPPRLVAMRDLAQIALREEPNLVDVLMMANAWQCEIIVARAVTTSWDELELTMDTPLLTWARNYEPDRRSRRLLAAHQGAGRMFTCQLAALEVLDGWGDRVAYLRAIAFPSPAYLRSRGLTPLTHAKRAIHGIRAS